nr:hypothetical protein Iba_chr12dCG0860 [Ipomoea batatas]
MYSETISTLSQLLAERENNWLSFCSHGFLCGSTRLFGFLCGSTRLFGGSILFSPPTSSCFFWGSILFSLPTGTRQWWKLFCKILLVEAITFIWKLVPDEVLQAFTVGKILFSTISGDHIEASSVLETTVLAYHKVINSGSDFCGLIRVVIDNIINNI